MPNTLHINLYVIYMKKVAEPQQSVSDLAIMFKRIGSPALIPTVVAPAKQEYDASMFA